MGSGPLVSVILPTYNDATHIRRAVDSVLKQTYSNWELVVWDDGSTDGTRDIFGSYDDPRIRFCPEQNRGQSYARNRAIRLSRGEYVAFLDSDDEWMDGKLSVQVEVMNTHHQVDLLFTDFLSVGATGAKAFTAFEGYSHAMKLLEVKQAGHRLFLIAGRLLEGLAFDNFIATDTVIVRREVLERVGLFREDLRVSEDFELWWRMGLNGVRFAYIDSVYLMRYKYPGGLSSPGASRCRGHLAALDACLQDSRSRERADHITYLRPLYRNAWLRVFSACGDAGDRRGMLEAFRESMRYGVTPGSFRVLFQSFFGNAGRRRQPEGARPRQRCGGEVN